MRSHSLHPLICAAALVFSSCALAQQNNRPLPPNVKVLRDIAYGTDSVSQKLDLYLPEGTGGPLPLIIWVHGGGWTGGDKAPCPAPRATANGYAIASLNYRLSQEAQFPAQIEDCKGAVRWLRAHAKEYNLDEKRFGAWGASAGGYLVTLLGTSGDVKELEGTVGGNAQFSSRVQAVSDLYGPVDLIKIDDFTRNHNGDASETNVDKLLGGPVSENMDSARRANPVAYLSKDDPPFLIMHGDKDMKVPLHQSEILRDALQNAKIDVQYLVMKGAGHGVMGPRIVQTTLEFFDKYLKAEK